MFFSFSNEKMISNILPDHVTKNKYQLLHRVGIEIGKREENIEIENGEKNETVFTGKLF
jgi:hypothetical protein